MGKIVINPTPTTQWQTLVAEASQACDTVLDTEIESYLVFLLMRFSLSTQLAQKIMALEYLHGVNQAGTQRTQALRDVGDQCLLYSGLFPGQAQRRRVRVSYYVNIGKSAYLSLANPNRSNTHDLFASLAEQFVSLMDILQCMRKTDNQVLLDPFAAEELWRDTGSTMALRDLQQFTTVAAPLKHVEFPPNNHKH